MTVRWRKNEILKKANFKKFMKDVFNQAEKLQTEQRGPPAFHRDGNVDMRREQEAELLITNKTRFDASKPKPFVHGKPENREIKRKWYENELPLCLNLVWNAKGERHFLSQCAITDSKTRPLLLKEYRKSKNALIDRINLEQEGWAE